MEFCPQINVSSPTGNIGKPINVFGVGTPCPFPQSNVLSESKY